MSAQRLVRTMVACCLALVLAGCASLPTSGPVQSEERRTYDENQSRVMIVPEPPPQGAIPFNIVTGFLTAMAGVDPGYATAREYLTTDAAAAWNPASGVLIYAGGTTPSVNGDQVIMSGAVVGSLGADGAFVASEDRTWTHDFKMVMQDGEWRISNPPPGLAVSEYMFNQGFTRVDTYFFPAGGKTLVPDPRYVLSGAWNRTTAARMVLAGPSTWLRAVTGQAGGVTLAGDVTMTNQGVADVPLSAGARDLSEEDATALAVEIAATMRSVNGVSRVRLVCDGDYLPVRAGWPDSSFPLSGVDAYDRARPGPPQVLLSVQNNLVVRQAGASTAPVAGDWGSTPRAMTSLGSNADQTQIAAVTADGLLAGPLGADPPVPRLPLPGLLRPQYDTSGNIWTVGSADSAVYVVGPQSYHQVDTSALAGLRIEAFQVSSDGRRIVIAGRTAGPDESRQEIGVALIAYTDDQPAAIIAWKPIRLSWDGAAFGSVRDVSWLGPSSLLVLGSSSASPPGVFDTDIDGLDVNDRGYPPLAGTLSQLAVHVTDTGAQVMALDEQGTIWSYQDPLRWTRAGGPASAVAF